MSEDKAHWLDRKLAGITLEQALYILFIVLAIASRFAMLGVRVQSHDESLHTRYSWELYNGEGFVHTPLMHGPFMFHAAALSYWLFGDSDATARVPAAILGVLLVAFPILLRRWLGRTGAVATSFLLLISPSILYYSRYIRMDIPVIVWSLIIVVAGWAYMRDRQDKYLYWFAGGLSLMFATKEVAFLYVAIFGSFFALRLLVGLLSCRWDRGQMRGWFQTGLIAMLVGVLIVGVGALGLGIAENAATQAALDPLAEGVEVAAASVPGQPWKVVEVIGGVVLSGGLLLALVSAFLGMKDRLRDYPEFDLVVLFSTLILPFMAPLPIKLLGGNPLDYETAGLIRSLAVFAPILGLTIAVGIWWDWQRWLRAAGVFYAIFAVLFTTVFTNGRGFATGWFGSLGYWLDQQAVQRGGQPWYFYLYVVPIYEFLPILGALGATIIWAFRDKGLLLIARLLGGGFQLEEGDRQKLFGFVPFAIWWTALTWLLYSYAGEKMGWLTTHFAIPMIVLAGWFLSRLLYAEDWAAVIKRGGWAIPMLVPLLLAALYLGVGPLLTGKVSFGGQQLESLISLGRVLGGLAVAVGAGIALVKYTGSLSAQRMMLTVTLSGLAFLGLATIRAAWMASYINYDTAKEPMVYAHGSPGTKIVMDQIEDISLRLYGDLSVKVAFDNDVSWPFWWYLRDYPNKTYFGENPSRDSLDAPLIVVGDKNWAKVEPYVGNRYQVFEYTLLWWPIEDYKGLTGDRIWGAIRNPAMRGALWDILVNRDYTAYAQATGRDYSLSHWPLRHQMRFYIRKDVVAQLWDYGVGPAMVETGFEDPYLTGFEPDLAPVQVLGGFGVASGQLQTPRGVAAGPDGLVYVADTGNNRVQVFDAAGNLVRGWGSLCNLEDPAASCVDPDGSGPQPLGAGQFKEPWGIEVAADGTVYVADTWNHRIQRFGSDGTFLGAWGHFGQAAAGQSAGSLGVFYGPRDVAVNADGLVYVTDTGNKRVQVFTADGEFVGEFGEGGPLEGQFDEQVGLDIGPDGLLYVADTWNGRVDVFDSNHTFLRQWTVEGWYGQSVNNKPYLATDTTGWVLITDPEMYRVLVFDAVGVYVGGFGRYSTEADGMALPTGIDVGSDGTIWVADAGNSRVLGYRFDR